MVYVSALPIRITIKEVKDLKNKKAPGPGNVLAELVKYKAFHFIEHPTKFFKSCINSGDVSEEWKLSFIIPIHITPKENIVIIKALRTSKNRMRICRQRSGGRSKIPSVYHLSILCRPSSSRCQPLTGQYTFYFCRFKKGV